MFGTRLFGFGFLQLFDRLEPLGNFIAPRAVVGFLVACGRWGRASRPAFCCFLWDFSVMPYYRKMPSEIRVRDGLRIEYGKCRIILHFSRFHPATDRRCLSDGISLPDVCIFTQPSANQYNPCRLNRLKEDGMNQLKLAVSGAQILFVAFGAMVLVPLLTGLNPALALLGAGLGTLLFQITTKRKVPIFSVLRLPLSRRLSTPSANGGCLPPCSGCLPPALCILCLPR
ncbi:uracil permease [Neisseria gonorrhoeae]|uniref:Uracil permease n=1 Tax=Neisseria gonorrhoeae TaxID=485 RepID=A0A378VY55_NEIGO|nr:uracil permease [Neisseria gonorrhoeae]